MGLLPDTLNCGLRMRRECREGFPRHWLQRNPLFSDPGMHHGTCVMYVPWCTSGSLIRGDEENAPDIPGACATRNFTYLARGPCHRHPFPFTSMIPDTWKTLMSLMISRILSRPQDNNQLVHVIPDSIFLMWIWKNDIRAHSADVEKCSTGNDGSFYHEDSKMAFHLLMVLWKNQTSIGLTIR